MLGWKLKIPRCVFRHLTRSYSTPIPKIAVVGSGPAGFYVTQGILKGHKTAEVDIYERVPVPFGLVRYGVAPDHPEVKNVINSFTSTARNSRCRFFGNVHIGENVTVADLRKHYNAVVLAYGADDDRMLGIPGEDLPNVLSARAFVGWYNGLPDHAQLPINLDVENVVVIGHGNVALDIARILLLPLDTLKTTDITEYAFYRLQQSRVRSVVLVGRRGPLQVAFTIKELREMLSLPDCISRLHESDFSSVTLEGLDRPRKRLTELMLKHAKVQNKDNTESKEWELRFCRSPNVILPANGRSGVQGVQFSVNRLEGDLLNPRAVSTDEQETIPCGLVLRSIGYRSIPIDSIIPFDTKRGIIKNSDGRVNTKPDLYCSGWVQTGPTGVIATTMNLSFGTARLILDDIKDGKPHFSTEKEGCQPILDVLSKAGVQVVTFADWEKIDSVEQSNGLLANKPREKIPDVSAMLAAASQTKHSS